MPPTLRCSSLTIHPTAPETHGEEARASESNRVNPREDYMPNLDSQLTHLCGRTGSDHSSYLVLYMPTSQMLILITY